jgi:hypothetical protein
VIDEAPFFESLAEPADEKETDGNLCIFIRNPTNQEEKLQT